MILISRDILLFVSLLVMVGGCSSQPESQGPDDVEIPDHLKNLENLTPYNADTKPAYGLQLERTVSYGSSEDEYVLVGGPEGTLARVDHGGRVFIPDRRQQVIHVFGSEGDYLTSMGRKGKGPGEFELMGDIGIDSTYFYVYDLNLKRINLFSLDSLTFSHTVNLDRTDWEGTNARKLGVTGGFFVLDEQTLLKEFVFSLPDDFEMWDNAAVLDSNSYRYYIMNHEGELASGEIFRQKRRQWTVVTFRGGPHATQLSFHGKPLMTLSQDGRIFSAWSEEFLVKVHDPEGQYLRAFYHPHKGPVLHQEELIEEFRGPYLKAAKTIELPDRWPALHTMLIDYNNRLWIATIVDDREVYQWWVLDEKGTLLARFVFPRQQSIEAIRDNSIYVREENDMEESIIVRYDIQMGNS